MNYLEFSSFAYPTIKDRLPVIVTKTIDYLHRKRNNLVEMGIVDEKDRKKAEEEAKLVIGRIVQLRNELLTDKKIVELESNAKDIAVWNKYIKEYEQINAKEALWFDAPWLYVECYLYRRLRQAFELSEYLKLFDPFQEQKQDALESSVDAMNILANYLEDLFTKTNNFDRHELENELNKLIEVFLL